MTPASAQPLLTAAAIRVHCGEVMAHIEAGASDWFTWRPERLEAAAGYVVDTIRSRYPDLRVPYHSRWRHFEAGGIDRWTALSHASGMDGAAQRDEQVRARIDLVIPSVLLDAGAGPRWQYRDAQHGLVLTRSEGLAIASFDWFRSGGWSSDPDHPLRADAAALQRVTAAQIAAAFQSGPDNPLLGLEGRAALLARLGAAAAAAPGVFGVAARLGNLLDHLRVRARDNRLDAAVVLEVLLQALGPVWPGRIALDGVALGDTSRHRAARGGLVPFHKLSQWLAYSLLEPLQEAGIAVTGLDALTGLPEYRNGGLLLDTGLLAPRDPALSTVPLQVGDEAVVEWRAATVIALDRLAVAIRRQLGVAAEAFPLACVLEGGTWAAGRRIAAALRPGGAPPLQIVSDGTVF